MDRSLALGNSGKQKWYNFEMFSLLKYYQSEEGDERHSGDKIPLEQEKMWFSSLKGKNQKLISSRSSFDSIPPRLILVK